MLLKRITDSLPQELSDLIPHLENAGIRTTESLIFTSDTQILLFIPLLQPVQLEALVSHCLQLTAAPEGSRDEYEREGWNWAGWGLKSLDDLMEDWDGRGVVELAGPRKVGKSLLALHAVLRMLVRDRGRFCRWVDTEGSFAPERARAVLKAWREKDISHVLARLKVIPCFKLEQVFDVVSQIQEETFEEDSMVITRVLVIDNISTHFKDMLSATSAQGHAELVSLMESISAVAYEMDMLAIIINSAVASQPINPLSSFNRMDIKPALGGAFTFCSDATLLMQETGRIFGLLDAEERARMSSAPGLRVLVEVIRSRVSSSGRWVVIETDGTRLFKVIPHHEVDERTTRISAGLPVGQARPAIGSLAQTLAP
ncbi:hypothetical protein IAU60_002742 [Kwoniella sp. DSM 27419]